MKTILVAAIVALSGCAFAPVDKPNIEKHGPRIVEVAFPNLKGADGLSIAEATLKSIGFEVAAMTAELNEVKTKTKPAMIPQICDCGSWNGNQITGTADSVMAVTVQNSGTVQANLKINFVCAASFKGTNLWGVTTRAETYQCASTGALEKQFVENFTKIKAARGL
ncbi:MAG: hypothetical protein WCI20_11880 [bacterium]